MTSALGVAVGIAVSVAGFIQAISEGAYLATFVFAPIGAIMIAIALVLVGDVSKRLWRRLTQKREFASVTDWHLVVRDALIVPASGEYSIDADEDEGPNGWNMVILRLDDGRLLTVYSGRWKTASNDRGDRMPRRLTIVTRKDYAGDDSVLSITSGAPASAQASPADDQPKSIDWADDARALTPRRVDRSEMLLLGPRGVALIHEDDLPASILKLLAS